MKVLYVAKHNQRNSADDEGAIVHAFRELGHEVITFRERPSPAYPHGSKADVLLFHHWPNFPTNFDCPSAFWCFDLIEWPETPERNERRVEWITRATRTVNVGFCTDGDWVAKDTTGKLVHLPQGADGRIVGRGERSRKELAPLLFTGSTVGCGARRAQFVEDLKARYGGMFYYVSKGYYREKLRDMVASCSIYLCPAAPVTDKYWSNRIYNATGFGAFALHPWSAELATQYSPVEVPMYSDMDHLFTMIDAYLGPLKHVRKGFSERALERTKERHLYRHRVELMVQELKRRGIG